MTLTEFLLEYVLPVVPYVLVMLAFAALTIALLTGLSLIIEGRFKARRAAKEAEALRREITDYDADANLSEMEAVLEHVTALRKAMVGQRRGHGA